MMSWTKSTAIQPVSFEATRICTGKVDQTGGYLSQQQFGVAEQQRCWDADCLYRLSHKTLVVACWFILIINGTQTGQLHT